MKKIFKVFFILFFLLLFPIIVDAKEFTKEEVDAAINKLSEIDFNGTGYLNVNSVSNINGYENCFKIYLDSENIDSSATDYFNLLKSFDGNKAFNFVLSYELKDNQLILHQEVMFTLSDDDVPGALSNSFYNSSPSTPMFDAYGYAVRAILNNLDIKNELKYYNEQNKLKDARSIEEYIDKYYDEDMTLKCMTGYENSHNTKRNYVVRPTLTSPKEPIINMNIKDKNNTFYISFYDDEDYCTHFFNVYKAYLEDYEIQPGGLNHYYKSDYEVLYHINLDLKEEKFIDEVVEEKTDNPTTSSTLYSFLNALLVTFYVSLLIGLFLKSIKKAN